MQENKLTKLTIIKRYIRKRRTNKKKQWVQSRKKYWKQQIKLSPISSVQFHTYSQQFCFCLIFYSWPSCIWCTVSNELAEQYPKKCLNNSQSEFQIFCQNKSFLLQNKMQNNWISSIFGLMLKDRSRPNCGSAAGWLVLVDLMFYRGFIVRW